MFKITDWGLIIQSPCGGHAGRVIGGMCQSFPSVADRIPGFGKGGFHAVATTPPFDAHVHRRNESGFCGFNGLYVTVSLFAYYTGVSMETIKPLWIRHCPYCICVKQPHSGISAL